MELKDFSYALGIEKREGRGEAEKTIYNEHIKVGGSQMTGL